MFSYWMYWLTCRNVDNSIAKKRSRIYLLNKEKNLFYRGAGRQQGKQQQQSKSSGIQHRQISNESEHGQISG